MLLWMDGFDAYGTNTTDITTLISQSGYGISLGGGGTTINSESDTRTGIGFSARNSAGGYFYLAFGVTSGIVTGMAIKLVSVSGVICKFVYNNLLGTLSDQMVLYANGENGISLTTGDQELIAASLPNCLFPGTWQYLEVSYSPSPTAGSIQVKLDGVAVINIASGKTSKTGQPNSVNQLNFSGSTLAPQSFGSMNIMFDDLYVCDNSGGSFNTFLGDCVVHTIYPNSDAGPNQMTINGGDGTHHYASINGAVPNGANYLSDNTPGVFASSLFTETSTNNFLATDTVQVGSKTYTFVASYTNTDGDVTVGASFLLSMGNLIAAINLGAGAGTAYATAMTANTEVSAVMTTNSSFTVTALTDGPGGNSYPSVYTASGTSAGSFAAATLLSGAVGHAELFGLPTFPVDIIDVLAVAVNVRAQKTAAGAATYQASMKLSSTEVDGPAQPVTTGYLTRQFVQTSPPGGGVWTLTNAEALLIGIKLP